MGTANMASHERNGPLHDRPLILCVCTGNICRSPLAEIVLSNALNSSLHLRVESAGTAAMVGDPMDPGSIAIAERYGFEGSSNHRARQLSSTLIEDASLILTMDRSHKRWILERAPRVKKRTFNLLEISALLEVTTPIEIANEYRSLDRLPSNPLVPGLEAIRMSRDRLSAGNSGGTEDIVDPYGQQMSVFEDMAKMLVPAAETVADFLLELPPETLKARK